MADGTRYDFVVVGGGSAGYAAARTAAALGLETAVVDGAEELGGLCILRGCMPSKTLIHSANSARHVKRAGEFGVQASLQGVDFAAVRARKRALVAEFAEFRQGQLGSGRFALLRGRAVFTGPHSLEVTLRDGGHQTLEAKTVLVATGSEIAWPNVPGLREADVWTSDTLLDAAEDPGSVIVLGGGAIALEMAHYLEAAGCQVTILQRSGHLLSDMDPDISEVVRRAFAERGMDIRTGTSLQRVEALEGAKQVTFEQDGAVHRVSAAQVLLALGRKAAVQALGTDAAGLELKNGRIAVAETMQTNVPHIFAAGDACGDADVVHVAVLQGEVAARNARAWLENGNAPEKMDYRLKLYGVFTEPQVASVGMNEAEAAASGRPWRAATYPFSDHGKSMVMGELHGFVKMIADTASGEILGAAVAGPEATELIHQATIAMQFRATVQQFLTIPFYHPTLSEIWTYPAEELSEHVTAAGR